MHTHTGTRAYVHTHTQEATIAHFPHCQALPLSFHSLHWMTSQPCPRPGAAHSPPSRRCSPSNQTLLQCSGPAQYCHCGLQDFRSSSGPTPCPLPLLSLSCLCFATLASLPSSVPQLLHMLFPLPGKLSSRTRLADPMRPGSLSFPVIFSEHQVFPSAHCLRVSADLPLIPCPLCAAWISIITLGYTFQGVIPCVPSTFHQTGCDEVGTESSTPPSRTWPRTGPIRQWLHEQRGGCLQVHTENHTNTPTGNAQELPHRQTPRQIHRHGPANPSTERQERWRHISVPSVPYASHQLVGTPATWLMGTPNLAPQVGPPVCGDLLDSVAALALASGNPGHRLPRQDSLGPASGLEVLVLISGSFQILHVLPQPV